MRLVHLTIVSIAVLFSVITLGVFTIGVPLAAHSDQFYENPNQNPQWFGWFLDNTMKTGKVKFSIPPSAWEMTEERFEVSLAEVRFFPGCGWFMYIVGCLVMYSTYFVALFKKASSKTQQDLVEKIPLNQVV
eukprot:TRINITY_DN781_c0_g1_i1.p1 TRINITY_DN781_c0_g1~~TRINITY_DN781_c0_g1_i1.p1  ORF type:complete len:132 (-),score=28.84 TRINITY_DN781_c0_g1_i1:201-596(-)